MRQQDLLSLQNRIRGVMGNAKARDFAKTAADRASKARIRLKRILADARAELPSAEYAAFFHWASRQTHLQIPGIDSVPVQYSELGHSPKGKTFTLEQAIASTCIELSRLCGSINTFLTLSNKLEHAFWNGERATATEALSLIETTFGASIWLAEASIAFKQLEEGLESQKRFAKQVVDKAQVRWRPLWFIISAYKTSQR
jgi:hypothetical protein